MWKEFSAKFGSNLGVRRTKVESIALQEFRDEMRFIDLRYIKKFIVTLNYRCREMLKAKEAGVGSVLQTLYHVFTTRTHDHNMDYWTA